MTSCVFEKYRGKADCPEPVWLGDLCREHWRVMEVMGRAPEVTEEDLVMETVETAAPQPATNGHAPPAGSTHPLCVGDVVTLNSGGERMTVVHAYPDTVYVMAYSEGKMTKFRLPRECVTKGE